MLRDLLFGVGFDVHGAGDLVAANDSVNGLRTDVEGAEVSVSGFSDETEYSAGRTVTAFEGMRDRAGGAIDYLNQNIVKITAVTAGLGGGLEFLNRRNAAVTESIGRMSRSTGILDDEMRSLIVSTSDVTFPIEEVAAVMELGTQRGIEGAESLREYAKFWDTVGDATGLSAEKLAEAGTSLQALDIGVENQTDALNAFGYVTQSTTTDVGEFLRFIERTGPQMKELGVGVNESAAMLGILENELGYTGRIARTEFRKAVNEADGDLGDMLDTLGVSEQVFGQYMDGVKGASDVIQDNADAHEESYTTMQRLQQRVSSLTTEYGGLLNDLGQLTPVLLAMGPLIKGLAVAKAGLALVMKSSLIPTIAMGTKAVIGFTIALLANPIGAIVAGVVSLVVGLVALIKNWDAASDSVQRFGGFIRDNVIGAKNMVLGFFSDIGDRIQGFKDSLLNIDIVGAIVGGIKEKAAEAIEAVKGFAGKIRGFLPFSPAEEGPLADLDKTGQGLVNTFGDSIKKHTRDIGGAMTGLGQQAQDGLAEGERSSNYKAESAGRSGVSIGDVYIQMTQQGNMEDMIVEAARRFEQKLRDAIDGYVNESASSEGVAIG